ncbi:MAG: EamA family transporter [Oligoflexia bacterium]|nr:EamA family transporter [Oligoflexia bacterium]
MTVQSTLLVVSQIFLKLGITRVSFTKISPAFILGVLKVHLFWFAGLSLFASALIWIYVLKHYPFNHAYPLVSISYIVSLFAAYYIFNEKITVLTVAGVFFILTGVVLISLNRQGV